MSVRVVTDSTADLPPEIAEELGIAVVPLLVVMGETGYRDGVDISPDELYARLPGAKSMPTTSQPPAGDFESVYRALASDGSAIVSIHISSRLSGTVSSALAAKTMLPDCAIEVVDSRSVSLGVGLAAVKAAEAARAGGALPDVLAAARRVIENQQVTFTVDTLEYLRRGGRLGRGAAFLGGMLSIKPILELREGEIHPVERVRTRRRALDRLAERVIAFGDGVTDVGVMHATTPGDAEHLRLRVQELLPNARLWAGRIGPVLGVHGGPGTIGMIAVR